MFSLLLLALAVGSVAPPCPQGFTRATSASQKFVVLSDAQRKEALGGYTPFSVPRKTLPLLAAAGLAPRAAVAGRATISGSRARKVLSAVVRALTERQHQIHGRSVTAFDKQRAVTAALAAADHVLGNAWVSSELITRVTADAVAIAKKTLEKKPVDRFPSQLLARATEANLDEQVPSHLFGHMRDAEQLTMANSLQSVLSAVTHPHDFPEFDSHNLKDGHDWAAGQPGLRKSFKARAAVSRASYLRSVRVAAATRMFHKTGDAELLPSYGAPAFDDDAVDGGYFYRHRPTPYPTPSPTPTPTPAPTPNWNVMFDPLKFSGAHKAVAALAVEHSLMTRDYAFANIAAAIRRVPRIKTSPMYVSRDRPSTVTQSATSIGLAKAKSLLEHTIDGAVFVAALEAALEMATAKMMVPEEGRLQLFRDVKTALAAAAPAMCAGAIATKCDKAGQSMHAFMSRVMHHAVLPPCVATVAKLTHTTRAKKIVHLSKADAPWLFPDYLQQSIKAAAKKNAAERAAAVAVEKKLATREKLLWDGSFEVDPQKFLRKKHLVLKKVPVYVATTTRPPNAEKSQLRHEGFGVHRYAHDDDDYLKSESEASAGAQGVDDDTA